METLFSSFTNDADSGVNGTEDSSADINIISEVAVRAAIDFIQLCCQQTACIAGRGMLEEELQKFVSSE